MPLKVLSHNIREGGTGRLKHIAALIHQQQPDVVALLEANRHANALRLAQELSMHLVFGQSNSAFHIAWLSQLPIQQQTNHRLPMLAKTLLEISVPWGEGNLPLFATHLGSHHDQHQPAEEVPALLEILRPLANTPHLLVGDFNALHPDDPVGLPPRGQAKQGEAAQGAPRQAIHSLLEAGYVDCYRQLHPQTPGYTYPASAAWLRLDYVFASPQMAARLVGCDVIRGPVVEQASDHCPVWAAFR